MPAEAAPYAIMAWLVGMIFVFPSLPAHRGMLLIALSGALFLPEAVSGAVELGPLKFPKGQAINYAMLFAGLLFSSDRLFAVGVRWFDWPMIVWCLVPIATTLVNDPPPDGGSVVRDAASQVLNQSVFWGVAYWVGRAYFQTPKEFEDLTLAVILAAMVYAVPCLWEVRMSPQLHSTVYGYTQHSFGQTIRFGGYRPMVFMQHGLAVGMFMASAALLAVWTRSLGRFPAYFGVFLVVVTILVKSTGAIVLGLVGGLVLWQAVGTKSRLGLLTLVTLPVVYVVTRTLGIWSGMELVDLTTTYINPERAESLEFRFGQENTLMDKALQRPLLGWGGWGRNRVANDDGQDVVVTDGFWIIQLGVYGILGLTAFGTAMLLPVARFALGTDPKDWRLPALAPVAASAVVVTLWCLDSLFNAMPNAIYPLLAGAVAGFELPAPSRPLPTPHPQAIPDVAPGRTQQEPDVPEVSPG